jgi:protein TonB
MFDQTFVDGTTKTRKPYTILLSLLLQVGAICVLILIPLIYTQTLPSAQLKSMLVAPAPPPPPPPPPPPAAPKVIPKPVVRQFVANQLLAPKVIPKTINKIEEAAPPPDTGMGVVGGTGDAGVTGGVIGGVMGGVPGAPPPPPPPKPKGPTGPVRIGGQVAEANLIRKVQPVYPPLAKSARVQGTVEFTAVIDKEGSITQLKLVRGHPLLVQAARDAVLQWKYRPTMLNGQPVDVVTDIIVNFTLSQ